MYMNLTVWISRILILSFCYSCSSPQDNKVINDSFAIFDSATQSYQGPVDEIAVLDFFPAVNYKIYKINGLGSFYIDGIRDTIKNYLRDGNIWESHLQEIMQKYIKPGSTVIDIGAHMGSHTVFMSKIAGNQGQVIAFEPQNKLFSELVMNLKLNECRNVTVCRCAIGQHISQIQMEPASPGNEGGTLIGSGGDIAQMITLDSLKLKNVSFIKIDVENFEEEVLQGAITTIDKNRPYILIEIMGNYNNNIPDRDAKTKKVISLLEGMRYSVRHINGCDWLAIPLKGQ